MEMKKRHFVRRKKKDAKMKTFFPLAMKKLIMNFEIQLERRNVFFLFEANIFRLKGNNLQKNQATTSKSTNNPK